MVYTTPDKIRSLLNLSLDEVSDTVLNDFIEKAQKQLLEWIATRVEMEPLTSYSETVYLTKHRHIADINFDKNIDKNDVSVYTIDEDGSINYLSVKSVVSETGRIELESGTEETVYCDYYYYDRKPDWTLIELATTLIASMMVVRRELGLTPEAFSLGTLSVRYSVTRQGADRLKDLHSNLVEVIHMLTDRVIVISEKSTLDIEREDVI